MLKRIKGLLEDRIVVGGVLLVFQFALMMVGITMLTEKLVFLYQLFQVLSVVIVIWLVRKYDNPAYKIAWIIVILLFPLVGGLFYLFWGNTPLNRARAMHQITPLDPDAFARGMFTPAREALEQAYPGQARRNRYIEGIGGTPVWQGTESEYFATGEAKFESLKVELELAKRFIFLEYFIIEEGEMWNTVLEILVRKARAGVDVRVLYDDAGCITKLPTHYDVYLCSLGLKCARFNKFIPTLNTYLNNRDHRKICVIDGNAGYMGGINLADEYINKVHRFGHWKDTAVLLRGEGVANMTAMFLQLWDCANRCESGDITPFLPTLSVPSDGFVQPFGDSPMDHVNVGETMYLQTINTAREYVYLTTPYLVLDNEMMTALCTAAQSGVDVRIITPGIPDKPTVYAVTRSFYQQLIKAGVRIYEYTPGFIHAKMCVSDGELAVVGTINMDFRSFYLHFECGVLFYGGSMPEKVRSDIVEIIRQSTEINLEWVHETPWAASVAASMLRLFSPLL